MKVTWTRLARRRANEIADFIAQDNVDAARTWLINIFGSVDRLRFFPESGRVVPEANRQEIREIIFKDYRVIYRIRRRGVSILTVRHGRQRLPLDEIK